MAFYIFFFGLVLSFSLSVVNVIASDHSPLQDFCVADTRSRVLVNGLACKDPKTVEAADFSFGGLHLEGNTSNPIGSSVTPVTVFQLPGLNTLGISLVRIDYAPSGVNPPHTHPRASEIITVLEGSLEVGFVTSSPENRHITKVLQKGDVFVFPIGLVHYQRNVGSGHAVAIVALSSQNPGVVIIASAVFGSKPSIANDILVKAFHVDKGVINYLHSIF
ncbi:PREDICTED: germin [Prunus dulcis]|uniref:Germin-like protein n=1 Tax=Prunus dulcis TaxID=3755 RepID=A0A5E4FJI3_PRUDU|nr:putative germin-like protein 2-1 [Prunus dulcis]VVA28344.1 PREDICTED: germin [Prunus dulcis]